MIFKYLYKILENNLELILSLHSEADVGQSLKLLVLAFIKTYLSQITKLFG